MENNQNLNNKELHDLKKKEKQAERENAEKKKKAKSILIWSGVLLVVVLSLWGMVALVGSGPGPTDGTLLPDPVRAEDWFLGNPSSTAVLVEYGDYQCPACAAYESFMRQLATEFGENLMLVYRNFPLNRIHPNADISARAAEAAGKQGRFWEMNHLLFDKQNDWAKAGNAEEIFIEYAKSLDLNNDQFKADLDSQAVKDKVAFDLASAERANLPGTPSFFLNGKLTENPQSYEQFRNLIVQTGASPTPTN